MRICLWLALPLLIVGCRPSSPPRDAHLQAPAELSRAAQERKLAKIFVNPRARALFAREPLALAPATSQDAAALASPPLWRKLDREQRFDAVLLAGPAAEVAPLLGHLANSPDFQLVHLDNWGALFLRGAPAAYRAPDPEKFKKQIPSDTDRGIYLAQMALMLEAAGQPAAAKEFTADALADAPNAAPVHVCAAALALGRGNYPDSIKHAEDALKLQPGDTAALEIEARALADAKMNDSAWQVATKLKSLAPDDMNALFLHARLAGAAHAYSAEQDSLERLIELAQKNSLSPTDYRVYLGQCFARQGLARPALQQLELALKDPALSKQQRADLETAVETVRSQAGALAQ